MRTIVLRSFTLRGSRDESKTRAHIRWTDDQDAWHFCVARSEVSALDQLAMIESQPGLGLVSCAVKATRQRPVKRAPESKHAKNRVHIDLVIPDPAAEKELLRLGATVVGKHQVGGGSHRWTVLQDPEGNEFCIATKSFTG
jgi:Glyoxalase-like domain